MNEIISNCSLKEGENYVHKLIDHGWSWKKLILSILAYLVSYVFVNAVLVVGIGLIASCFGLGDAYWQAASSGNFESLPFGEKMYDLIIFAMFPAGIIANRLVFKTKVGDMISVEGRVRWKWILYCTYFLLPIMVLCTVAQEMMLRPLDFQFTTKVSISIVVTIIITPLQCLGEEILFRGWLLQVLGPIFKNKKIAWLILGVGVSVIFAIAHYAGNVFVIISLAQFGILTVALIYITGGLEAGIIMHSINNSVLFIIKALTENGNQILSNTVSNDATKDAILSMISTFIFFFVVVWLWNKYQQK